MKRASDSPPERSRPLAAAVWMMGSITGFCFIAISGRQIGAALDTFEMMLYRSLIGVVVWSAALTVSRRWYLVEARHLGLHLSRNVVHFAAQNLWLLALPLIPLAQLFALEFSYPIIVALAAPFFLSERLTRRRLLAAGLGFLGILIVARPFGAGGLSPGLLAALCSAFGFAGAAIFTKRLTRVATVPCIIFWLAVMQSGLGLIGAGADLSIALPRGETCLWVLVMGLAGLGAHVSLTNALSLAPASVVTPIDFLRLPVIAVVGMALYGEPFDIAVLAGGAVILAANLVNLHRKTVPADHISQGKPPDVT